MKVRSFLTVATVLGMALGASRSEAQGYTYYGPVIARNSGATCRAANRPQEDWLRHNIYGAEVNPYMPGSASFSSLYCPISRRTVSPYSVDEPSSGGDKVDLETVDVWVKHTPYGNLGKSLGCSVSAQGAATGSSYYSATLYACYSDGGCSFVDTSTTGYRHLRFNRPLSATPLTGLWITNLVIGCSVPRGSSIIGSVSTFPSW